MRAPARRSPAKTAHDAFDADEPYAHGELLPGERIGQPLARTGGKAMLRGMVILITFGGGWALLSGQVTLPEWLAEIAAVSPSTDRRVPGSVEPTRSAVATPSPPANAEPTPSPTALHALPSTPQSQAASKAAATPDAAAPSPAPPLTTAVLPPAATGSDAPLASRLPPPTADPADPYQMRAEAVGLHPDLSRVLLARLSSTDYRNAGIAIQTAVAETPDSAVFVWPRQRKPELALFQVRFVPGAAPGCRRYVVTVTKDGWLTTAPPMERCGPQPGQPRRE
jgi:hypothetical protein